jgi:hypothetical protein
MKPRNWKFDERVSKVVMSCLLLLLIPVCAPMRAGTTFGPKAWDRFIFVDGVDTTEVQAVDVGEFFRIRLTATEKGLHIFQWTKTEFGFYDQVVLLKILRINGLRFKDSPDASECKYAILPWELFYKKFRPANSTWLEFMKYAQ